MIPNCARHGTLAGTSIGPALQIVTELSPLDGLPVEELREQVPRTCGDAAFPGLGVAKIRQIHEAPHRLLPELEAVVRDGRSARLRFGAGAADNASRESHSARPQFLPHHAAGERRPARRAELIARDLRIIGGMRRSELVKELTILGRGSAGGSVQAYGAVAWRL